MRTTYVFDYCIGERVTLTAINEHGYVIGQMVTTDGPEYRVAYWFDGERKCEWLPPYELQQENLR